MIKQLQPGQYCGATSRELRVDGLVLTETVHAPRLKTPRHSHRMGYLCFLLRGNFTEVRGRRRRDLEPDSLWFHPAGEEHHESMHGETVRSFNVEIDADWLDRQDVSVAALDGPAPLRHHRARWSAARLYREFRGGVPPSDMVVEGTVLETLIEMAGGVPGSERRPPWLKTVRELLHDRFAEPLKHAEIAGEIGIHPVYLATAFKQHCRISVGEYLRRVRLDYASRELSRPDRSLIEVSLAAGFFDQAHLCRTFKRYTGFTPSEYRALFA